MTDKQEDSKIDSTIILIGAMNTGKSTIAALLADALSMPRIPMDTVRFDYYKEIGYTDEEAKAIFETEGVLGIMKYWKPFEAHAVERILQDHQHCVIDFGAGHSVYDDEARFARVQQILARYEHVIMLLPSPDLDKSVEVLRERTNMDFDGFDVHTYMVKHPSNHKLATHVVYTDGKTPEQTCAEIVELVKQDS